MNAIDKSLIDAMFRERLYAKSLYEYTKAVWHLIEGAPYIDNWHVKVVCEHLEAVTSREIRNIIFNLGPRTMKTSIICVIWQTWVWIQEPMAQFLMVSNGEDLAKKCATGSLNIIESDFYQKHWGRKFRLSRGQKEKLNYTNTKHGARMSTTIRSTVIGRGGDFLICFPYDSLIRTSEGDLKIGDIVENKLDIKILSYSHDKGVTENKEIELWQDSETELMVEIEFEDRLIECTPEHPIYIKGKGYVAAKDIRDGDVVLCLS